MVTSPGRLDGTNEIGPSRPLGSDARCDCARPMSGERRMRILAKLAAGADGHLTAQRLGEVCRSVTGATGAGIMLMSGDMPLGSLCTTGDVRSLIEDLQYTLGEGPCVDARTGRAGHGEGLCPSAEARPQPQSPSHRGRPGHQRQDAAGVVPRSLSRARGRRARPVSGQVPDQDGQGVVEAGARRELLVRGQALTPIGPVRGRELAMPRG